MKPYLAKERNKKIIEIDFLKNQNGNTDVQYKDEYLNINSVNLDLSEDVYRIFNYEYFLNDFKDKKLTLVHPLEWQDPFENFFLNAVGKREDGMLVDFGPVRNSFYSQCWSLKKECDGLWRNYKGQNEFAIQVKTNTKKLFNSIYDINNTFHYLSNFIGKVDYVSDEEIMSFFNERVDFSNFQSGMEFALTLLIKRLPFSYEEEVRIIVKAGESYDTTNSLLKIELDLNQIIEEIIFDPWISDEMFNDKTEELRNNGYLGEIKKSKLYEEPHFIINM